MYQPNPPDYKGGIVLCLVIAIVIGTIINLPYIADIYGYSEVPDVSGHTSLCERSYLRFDSYTPFITNALYKDTWELTEGIPKYTQRSERLHL